MYMTLHVSIISWCLSLPTFATSDLTINQNHQDMRSYSSLLCGWAPSNLFESAGMMSSSHYDTVIIGVPGVCMCMCVSFMETLFRWNMKESSPRRHRRAMLLRGIRSALGVSFCRYYIVLLYGCRRFLNVASVLSEIWKVSEVLLVKL